MNQFIKNILLFFEDISFQHGLAGFITAMISIVIICVIVAVSFWSNVIALLFIFILSDYVKGKQIEKLQQDVKKINLTLSPNKNIDFDKAYEEVDNI